MPRRFNPLLDKLPVTAHVNGHEYPVQSDYRTALGYLRLLKDKETAEEDKALLGLSMFFGDEILRDDVAGLFDFMGWYLRRGQEQPKKDDEAKEPRHFDIEIDSGRIYAAFFQTYHINLTKVRMHWWTFLALLEDLPKGTHLAEIIELRGRTAEKWMTPAQKNSLAKAQRYYSIDDEEEPDIMAGLFECLAEASR